MSNFAPEVEDALSRASKEAGVDLDTLRRFTKIESGGDPGNTTGSYKGLLQLSNAEFTKYGGGNIYDPFDNARAGAFKLKAESAAFKTKYGRDPDAGDLYMIHQQGEGGYAAHMAAPNRLAWQSMLSTSEGRQKGEAWAKAAIWGNVPDAQKKVWGSVDNVTSDAFMKMWRGKVGAEDGARPLVVDTSSAPVASVTAPATPDDKLQFGTVTANDPVTDVEMHRAEAAKNPYGLAEGAWEAMKDAQTIRWTAQSLGLDNNLPDPNWRPTAETFKAAREGIPEEHQGLLAGAHSEADLDARRERILADMESERRFAAMGWTGAGLRLLAGFTDVGGIAASAFAPEIGVPAKASYFARIAAKAASAGALNTALEIPRVMNKPTAQGSDLLWAAGSGIAAGAAFGALARNPAVSGEVAALERIGKSMVRQAEDEGVATIMPGKSVGAAQTSSRETLTANAEDWLHKTVDDFVDRSAFAPVRWDDAGRGKASDNAVTRAFVGGTVLDVVGNKDRSKVIGTAAEEWQKQLHLDFTTKAYKAHRVGFADWLSRHVGEEKGPRELEADFRALVTDYIDNRRPEVEFDPAVAKVGELQRKLYADWLDYARNPGLLDGSERRPVKGFDNIPKDPSYRPNIPDHERIDALSIRFGDDAMRQFIATAFKAKLPEIADALAERMAKGYWRTLRETSAGMSNLDRVLHGGDVEALRVALQDLDIHGDDLERVVGLVRPKPTEGAANTHAKRRAPYDNGFTAMVRDRDGELVELRMKDIFRDDYLENFTSYSRTMSGNIAMGMVRVKNPLHHPVENPDAPAHLIDGITSRGDFDALVRDMRAVWDAKTGLPQEKRKRLADADEARMRWLYDRVTGKPDAFDATTAGKALRIVRDYNFTRVMNQVGLAQVGETMGIVSQFGFRAAMEAMPSFRAFVRNAKTGELDDAVAREVESLTCFGTDFFRDGFRSVEDSGGAIINRSWDGKLFNRVDDALHVMKRITNVASAMAPVDTFARRWASAAAVMKIVNAAIKDGDGAAHGLNMDRMRALGVDDVMAKRIFGQIRKFSTEVEADGTTRKYAVGNFGKWDDTEAFAHFRTAVWRWSRLAIQENHLGQSNRILGSSIGRTIFQFRSFMLGAHTTQLLRNMNIRDFSGFATWMTTSVFGAMTYAAQSHLNAIGRSDREAYLEKRLSGERLTAALVQRGAWSGLIPQFVDTGADLLGFDPIFDTRASGTQSSFLDNPSFDLGRTAVRASHGLTRAAREGDWSQGEARALARVLPFQNMLPVVMLLNEFVSRMPEHAPKGQ